MELESHVGFSGGLRGGGGGGVSAPYLAAATLEALFHVATRMPADTPDAILNKVTRTSSNTRVRVRALTRKKNHMHIEITYYYEVVVLSYAIKYHLYKNCVNL